MSIELEFKMEDDDSPVTLIAVDPNDPLPAIGDAVTLSASMWPKKKGSGNVIIVKRQFVYDDKDKLQRIRYMVNSLDAQTRGRTRKSK